MSDFERTLLILGGARSGKSRHGQAVAEAIGGRLVYIATAQAFDDEMAERIARHRADRDSRWETVEAPLRLTEAIDRIDAIGTVTVIDCLTLWTSNLLLGDYDIADASEALSVRLAAAKGRIILIANETGLGIVPDNALARRFRDEAGLVNQRVASRVDAVDFVVAGIPRRWN